MPNAIPILVVLDLGIDTVKFFLLMERTERKEM
jgi:hypothetical protein